MLFVNGLYVNRLDFDAFPRYAFYTSAAQKPQAPEVLHTYIYFVVFAMVLLDALQAFIRCKSFVSVFLQIRICALFALAYNMINNDTANKRQTPISSTVLAIIIIYNEHKIFVVVVDSFVVCKIEANYYEPTHKE